MSKISVTLPKSLRVQIEEAAREEGISVDQYVAFAAAEKMAAQDAARYLEERAKRGSREKLLRVLAKAPDVEPDAHDRL